jgi:hypothetical protein
MIIPVSPFEMLIYSTLKLETESGTGTAFFFKFDFTAGNHITVLLTNKHVISGSKTGKMKFAEAQLINKQPNPTDQFFEVEIQDFESKWILHPDPEIDLCALPLINIYQQCLRKKKTPYIMQLTEKEIADSKVLINCDAVEDILMIGYPIGLGDEFNRLPITRKGITATHPLSDLDGKQIGLIDAACYPGSSGSPIFLYNSGKPDKSGNISIGHQIHLLGILFQGPVMYIDGQIVRSPIPMKIDPIIRSSVMINLGYYIKAMEILELKKSVFNELKNTFI